MPDPASTPVMVLRAKVTAGFEAPVTYPGPAGKVRISDFNGDGKQDVASLGFNNKGQAPQVGLYLSNGNGTLTAGATVTNGGLSARDFAVADVNHDQKDDVIVSSFMGIEAAISNGDGTLKNPIVTATKYYGSIAAGDIDLDGEPDTAVGYSDMGMSYQFARGIGNGVFDTPIVLGSNGSAGNLQFVDIDKDGRLDVFVIDQREPALAAINIYRNICGG